jgi:iron complex transport system substrate-binding protein
MSETENRYQLGKDGFAGWRAIRQLVMETQNRVGNRMKTIRRIAGKSVLFACIAALLLAACSSNNAANDAEGQTSDAGAAAGDAQFPIKIQHAFGETVIPSKPERIVTISWANHDVVLALGVVPVGFSAANYGVQDDSGLLPWTKQKLEELGVTEPNVFQDTDGLDFEAISDADPDVILAAYSGITQEEYDTLSQIAPVVAYPDQPWVISWREQVRMNAAGIGMAAEGEQLIRELEQFIADRVAQYPELEGVRALFAYFSPSDLSSYYIYMPDDPRGAFLQEFGLEFPESVQPYVTSDAVFALSLSAENADALKDADVIVAYGDEALLQALQADPVFGKIPAIANGAMVLVPDGTPFAAAVNPNPLSIQYATDEYLAMIAEAARKIKQ